MVVQAVAGVVKADCNLFGRSSLAAPTTFSLLNPPTSRPMTAVTAIAKPPPIVTRNAARPSRAAEMAAKCTKRGEAYQGQHCDRGDALGWRGDKEGCYRTAAKDAKLVAEIHAACSGRARNPVSIPSSSRMCEPSRSRALSC